MSVMIVSGFDIAEAVAELRRQGGDTAAIEAKAARSGFPADIAITLSAFANTPGGGTIIFGLAETAGFAAVGVYDVAHCQQAVASVARNAVTPPVAVITEPTDFEGVTLVVTRVPEADRQAKPVRAKGTGRAYLRMYDGDYPLSSLEEQSLIAQRGQPVYDTEPVSGATIDDLDEYALADYVRARQQDAPVLTGMDRLDVLRHTGVLDRDGRTPSLAGLLALGVYPQQFFPNLAIQAVLDAGSSPVARVLDSRYVVGSIPRMIDDAVAWVARVTLSAIVDRPGGVVVDQPQYPPAVVRELVANMLIHRDLGPHALNAPATIHVGPDGLVVANPGGLLGLTVPALGHAPSSLRNARLTEILRYVRDPAGHRVVERLGTGIPIVTAALHAAQMPPAAFIDQGVRFTVRVRPANPAAETATTEERAVLDTVTAQLRTVRQIARAVGFGERKTRSLLAQLVTAGAVATQQIDGRTKGYRRT